MGTLYRRGKKGIYWLQYYYRGRQIRESSKSAKRKDAERLLKTREGEIAQGKLPQLYFDKVLFQELADDFLRDYEVNGRKSLERATHSVNQLMGFFGDVKASTIDTARVNKYIEKRLSDKAAPATVNRELAALKRMFSLAVIAEKVDRRPHIPRLKENNVRTGFFEHGEFLALRDALPEYLRGLVTFAYRSGWRLGEIVNLKWSQVDCEAGVVRLEPGTTKNSDGRTLYLDHELRAVIERQYELRKKTGRITPYVFTNAAGTKRIRDFRWHWEKACSKANLGERLFHDFRRTAVRNMVRAGVPERVAMQVSGHKTRAIFDR